MSKQTLSVVIGRFQGFHNMHLGMMLDALSVSENLLVILGSAYQPATPRNPYSVEDRMAVILGSLAENGIDVGRVFIHPIVDTAGDDSKWVSSVEEAVRAVGYPDREVTLVGHIKEDTGYLETFGSWRYHEFESASIITASMVRNFVKHNMWLAVEVNTPAASMGFLLEHDHTYVHEFEQHIIDAKKKLEDFPHAGHLNCPTADALVTYRGKALMIIRKNHPFKGMLAIAGGHKQSNETFEQCALRELKEETGIVLREGVSKGSKLFDKPDRDPVCCKPTVAFTFEFQNATPVKMMEVNVADDAIGHEWVPLAELDDYRHKIAFDHFDIIKSFYPKGEV